LVEKYDAFIAKEVHKFFATHDVHYTHFEDYLQQARLGVLEYGVKHTIDPNNMTALDHYKLKMHIFHVLFEYWCRDHPLSGVNHSNYKKTQVKRAIAGCSLEQEENLEYKPIKDAMDKSEVMSFAFESPIIISMILDGYNKASIMKAAHITRSQLDTLLKREGANYFNRAV